MAKNGSKKQRYRRRLFTVIMVGGIGALGLMCCFGLEKEKFSRPSVSSRSAKRRGVFLHELQLATLNNEKDQRIKPEEAWAETIIENYESFSIMRKGVAGVRVCVRLKYPTGKDVDDDPLWDGLYVELNGKAPEARGGVWDSTGATLDFASRSSDEIPENGEIAICGHRAKVISKFRYSIK